MRSNPGSGAVQRASWIFAAEYGERILLRARITEDAQVRIIALQHRDRRIQHDGGVDLTLLHRRHSGGSEPDADDGSAGGIEPVFLQKVLEKEIGRGARSADA